MQNRKKVAFILAGITLLLTGWRGAIATDSTTLAPFKAKPSGIFILANGTTLPLYTINKAVKIYDANNAPVGDRQCPTGMRRSFNVALSETDQGCGSSSVIALFVDCNFESQESYSLICTEARLACSEGDAHVILNWTIYCRP
ncbi:MAG TPA: hypothetical protein VLJ15_01780 [Gammaproteobacteria bacterium]|nr:hypothetical protein [Gammaproteobacteria bacterium]